MLSDGVKISKEMNPLDATAFDRFLNFAQKHKKMFAFGGLFAAVAIVGATMRSYNNEVAQKTEVARPKPDGFN